MNRMKNKEKGMKACLQVWKQMHLNLPNRIGVCCIKTFSDAQVDYEELDNNNFKDIANRRDMVEIRKKFLAGEVPSICRNCGNMEEFSTEEELAERLLSEGVELCTTEGGTIDLLNVENINELCVEFTTACNFKCSYCAHSNPVYKIKGQFIDVDNFLKVFAHIKKQVNIKEITTIGLGEFTMLKDWEKIITYIKDNFSSVKLRVYSNFGKEFTYEEIVSLGRADEIVVSFDTYDSALFKKIRTGNLATVLNNIKRVRKYREANHSAYPVVQIAAVINSETINTLEDFVTSLKRDDICEKLMLSPMNLPLSYAKQIGVYPLITNKSSTDDINSTRQTLIMIKKKGEELELPIIFTGEFFKLIYEKEGDRNYGQGSNMLL